MKMRGATPSKRPSGTLRGCMLLCLMPIVPAAQAAPVSGEVLPLRQPDGQRIQVRIWGDEYYQVVESLDGYTLVQDPKTNVICYARLSPDKQELVSTGIRLDDSADKTGQGLVPHVRIRAESARAKAAAARARFETVTRANLPVMANGDPVSTATVGSVVGICLIIDFSDDVATIPASEVANYCNKVGYNGFGNNGSVRDYFTDVSNGLLTYTNHVPTAYYRALQPKDYYKDPAIDYTVRTRELITEALTALDNSGFDFSQYDADHNGVVDALNCFYAGYSESAWSKGLWPHASSLAYWSDGVRTGRYQITDMQSSLRLSTFCHENGHMLCGWPDLYDYDGDSNGVGQFCIMCAYTSGTNPQEPCAYLKYVAGWTNTTTLSLPATGLTLPTATNNVFYRFPHPTLWNEYYIIENRQRTGRDSGLPDHGMAIWHIDVQGSNNNQQRTPTQHYRATLVQADGRWDLEADRGNGDSTDLWAAPTYTECGPATNPNTSWWDGSDSDLFIRNISSSAATMTFDFAVGWDCNANGVPDVQDISNGTSRDCNSNGVPEECDLAEGRVADCDDNETPDSCDADFDIDGHIDACDNCPQDANADQANSDVDSEGDACDDDDDNDTIADIADNCRSVANPGQTDTDGDGAGDACDVCPNTIAMVAVDAEGCPPDVPGDFDRDGDVDQADFGHMQLCLGSGLTLADPACQNAVLDGDTDVDPNDMAIFMQCHGGTNVAGDPACAN